MQHMEIVTAAEIKYVSQGSTLLTRPDTLLGI